MINLLYISIASAFIWATFFYSTHNCTGTSDADFEHFNLGRSIAIGVEDLAGIYRMEEQGEDPYPSPMTIGMVETPNPAHNFVISSSQPGFLRTFGTGVSVQIGTSAVLKFSISINAILGSELIKGDARFVKKLPNKDLQAYKSLNISYTGGLNVPFLDWLGANLNSDVSIEGMKEARERLSNYMPLTVQARQILQRQPGVKLRISGSKTITGTSFAPMLYFAFIKVARVNLVDGSIVLVVSTNPNDIVIASVDGKIVLQRGAEDFNVQVLDN